jgi:7-keto-8-aminopelargonate synthetase-like enzyme
MNLFKQTLRPPPLSQLIQSRMREDDFKRVKRLGFLLEHFHLKHTVTELVSGRKIVINGREVINFGSANYLGYDQHPEVIKASQEALAKLGAHAGCSRIFSSHFNIVALEQEISALVGSQATMIGHNISQIHAGVIPALFSSENSVLYVDRFAHTSIFQACLIAKAKGAEIVRVDVADLKETQQKIQSTKKERNCLFVMESIRCRAIFPLLFSFRKWQRMKTSFSMWMTPMGLVYTAKMVVGSGKNLT